MEKLNNMTCGECKYHKNMRCHLPQRSFIIVPEEDACRHFIPKPKLTVFDHITQSVEKLAETLVHNKMYMVQDGILQYWVSSYFSTILPGKSWEYESDAIAATLEELQKEVKDA